MVAGWRHGLTSLVKMMKSIQGTKYIIQQPKFREAEKGWDFGISMLVTGVPHYFFIRLMISVVGKLDPWDCADRKDDQWRQATSLRLY